MWISDTIEDKKTYVRRYEFVIDIKRPKVRTCNTDMNNWWFRPTTKTTTAKTTGNVHLPHNEIGRAYQGKQTHFGYAHSHVFSFFPSKLTHYLCYCSMSSLYCTLHSNEYNILKAAICSFLSSIRTLITSLDTVWFLGVYVPGVAPPRTDRCIWTSKLRQPSTNSVNYSMLSTDRRDEKGCSLRDP